MNVKSTTGQRLRNVTVLERQKNEIAGSSDFTIRNPALLRVDLRGHSLLVPGHPDADRAWWLGNPRKSPGAHDVRTYDLWSNGPDGHDGTEDDIGSWNLQEGPKK